uniref:Uncharacterized protein n=1 Tax=Mus musculus TaxID=10090 RepID=Q6R5D1_MOUSE|nr:unknown [Mus musculus]
MWLLGFELWTFGRAVGCSYPLSHLTSPPISFLIWLHSMSSSSVFFPVPMKNLPGRNQGFFFFSLSLFF